MSFLYWGFFLYVLKVMELMLTLRWTKCITLASRKHANVNELVHEKTNNLGVRPGLI